MTAAQPPIDQDVLVGLRKGDDRSLEQLFRERYPGLIQEASTQLDDPAGAPRVVETAFRRVWDERASFETPDALDSFLHTAVREGAVREAKRLATLHRIEAGAHIRVAHHATATPTVDQAWSHLSSTIHAAPADLEAIKKARTAHARHEAAEHLSAIADRRRHIMPIAIGIGIAILVAAPLWWLSQRTTDAMISRALASPNAREVTTVQRQQASVTLLDGSTATVGADSRLIIVPDFGTSVRAVKLDGSAMFTVAPGERHTFTVRAGNATLTATGTKFGVRAYPTDSVVLVSVSEGSVRAKTDKEAGEATTGGGLAVAKDGTVRPIAGRPLEEAFSWTDNRFVAGPRPLREVIPEVKRWYAMELWVPDTSLMTRTVVVEASLDSPRDAIAALERPGRLKFDYEGTNMVLRDAATAARPRRQGR
jgi:transmembrane sensor